MASDDLDRFEAIARRRRSVRAFRPEPVDRALIRRALDSAATAPSNCNTQPWRVEIVSGAALVALREALIARFRGGEEPTHDVPPPFVYAGLHRERQIDAAVWLFAAQGVARHDREARVRSMQRNYEFFDAPHAAFLFLPDGAGAREAGDCGQFAQTFMLALAAGGVGSCAQGSLSAYPEIVRDVLQLGGEGQLLMGISFGYADESDPTSAVRPRRCAVDDFTRFHDRAAR